MKDTLIILLIILELTACSQQVTNHTPSQEYGEKGPAGYSDRLMNKLENGIDFVASGAEPFWSLDIDFDKFINFKGVHGDSVQAPVPEGVRLKESAATSFKVNKGANPLTIIIYDQSCVDNLSGKELPKTVEITVADKHYKGCGSYLSDYRLNDIWVLESINNTKIDTSDFSKGLPRLELNLAQGLVFTFAGCNEFSGSMEVQGKKIHFGRFSGTLMACPNLNFERNYLSYLANKTISFKIEPGRLSMQVSPDSTFNYRKTD